MKLLSKLILALLFAANLAVAQGEKYIAKALQPMVDEGAIPGAVTVVANADKILSLDVFGYADIAAKKPMKRDSMFWIASMSKPITAAAFMMLVDEGKANLDDPISKYIPEFKDMKVKGKDGSIVDADKPITLRMLLSHTSGLSYSVPAEKPTLDILPIKDVVKEYASNPMHSQPGTTYVYSNAGINTIGRLIEILSGMPYEKFLEERIFKPLGMVDTTFFPTAAQVERMASIYGSDEGKTKFVERKITHLKYPLDGAGRYPVPGGGLFSTADDMTKFCQMIARMGEWKGKRLISEKSINEMATRQTPDGQGSYGLGCGVGGGGLGHGGALATEMLIHPKNGEVLVFLVQRSGDFPKDGNKAWDIFKEAARKVFKDGK